MSEPLLGVYIHIPFCRSKCAYCAFDSYRYHEDRMAAYLAAVHLEMERSNPDGVDRTVESVFFGGGTPSLLTPTQARGVLSSLERSGTLLSGAEITLEANPGTVTPPLLEGFRAAGFNRISFGAEVLDDDSLGALGRIHTTDDVVAAVRASRAAGFDNLNLDLIYGLSGQTTASWLDTLTAALDLDPDHLSAYALQIEPMTRIQHDLAAGRLALPSDEDVLQMERDAVRLLASRGYERYEISNYARPGKRCRHNLLYWRHDDVRGFGSSAHSSINGRHATNIGRPEAYVERLRDGVSPVATEEILEPDHCAREAVAFGLRLTDGVDLDAVGSRYGVSVRHSLQPALSRLRHDGLVTERANRLVLTELGVRFADTVGMALV